MAKDKTRQPSLPEILRLGAELAQVKAGMKPKQWRKLVGQAHDRGFTVSGYLSGAPDPLKERLPSAIRAEAQRNVNTVYAPVMTNLDNQERAANALAEKRKVDNQAYQTWLQGQFAKIDAQSTAADNALVARQQSIQQDSRAGWDTAQANAYAAASMTPGNVSKPQDSTALAQIAPAAQMSDSTIAAARQQSSDIIAANKTLGADTQSSALAAAALMEAQRSGDLWKSLADIRDTRATATQEQGAASLQERSRLQGIEMEKASGNREYAAAAQKLGIESEKLRQDALESKRNYDLENSKFKLSRWKAKNSAAVEQAKIDLGYDKIAAQDGRAAADRALDRALANKRSRDKAKDRAATAVEKEKDRKAAAEKNKPGAKGPSDAEKSTSQKVYGTITVAKQAGLDSYNGNGKDEAKTRADLKAAGYSGAILNITMDLIVHGKLSPPNVSAARNLGLIVPKEWLP